MITCFLSAFLRLCSGHHFRLVSTLILTEVILLLAQIWTSVYVALVFVFCIWPATIWFPIVCIIYSLYSVDTFFASHAKQMHYIVHYVFVN